MALKTKRATKEEQLRYGRMVEDALGICWKLQNDVALSEYDRRALDAMPPNVQQAIREVGKL
jgi:hypothetical protein